MVLAMRNTSVNKMVQCNGKRVLNATSLQTVNYVTVTMDAIASKVTMEMGLTHAIVCVYIFLHPCYH